MADPDVSARMRDDWNARAREDAGYYVAFGRRDQDDAEFFATATQVINNLEKELKRVPAKERTHWKALEIGCGPGRLMRPMSRHFAEIHGIDVSDEMIARATENLRETPNAFPHVGDGSRLSQFEDASIDFIYSYAVFQHIPSREVIETYVREVHRLLRPGGLFKFQVQGYLATTSTPDDTWHGVPFSEQQAREMAERTGFEMRYSYGAGVQYFWLWYFKQPAAAL